MGQQQLILLVLATVIVGLATVVGIRAFSENSAKASADALTQDAIRIASDLQAWKLKPAPFGGQGLDDSGGSSTAYGASDFTNASFTELGYSSDGTGATATYTNVNGTFTITTGSSDGALIVGESLDYNQGETGQRVEVRVCGTSDDDVLGEVTQLAGTSTGASAPSC